jgi:hypothetical protein
VSPVKYELVLYIPENDILRSHCLENLKSYVNLSQRSTKQHDIKEQWDNGGMVPRLRRLGIC